MVRPEFFQDSVRRFQLFHLVTDFYLLSLNFSFHLPYLQNLTLACQHYLADPNSSLEILLLAPWMFSFPQRIECRSKYLVAKSNSYWETWPTEINSVWQYLMGELHYLSHLCWYFRPIFFLYHSSKTLQMQIQNYSHWTNLTGLLIYQLICFLLDIQLGLKILTSYYLIS